MAGALGLAPRLVTYLMSFLTLGIFWLGQQTQLDQFARTDRDLVWIHIAFLAMVSTMPLSTSLLAEFMTYRIALLAYWGNLALLGLALHASWRYARRAGLVRDDVAPAISAAMTRRIFVGQALYALSAALCVINTYWSIAFIVLIQLNYAIHPRLRGRRYG
ncbi:MAG: TMEM175 family protein [Pseudomonadota bacterium]